MECVRDHNPNEEKKRKRGGEKEGLPIFPKPREAAKEGGRGEEKKGGRVGFCLAFYLGHVLSLNEKGEKKKRVAMRPTNGPHMSKRGEGGKGEEKKIVFFLFR